MSKRDIGVINAKGRGKETNEDYHFGAGGQMFGGHDVYFLSIADGMGGHDNAKSASHHVIEKQEGWWNDAVGQSLDIQELIAAFENGQGNEFRQLNQELIDMGSNDNVKMGTTLSSLVLVNNMYLIHHVGDARIYRYSLNGHDTEETSELDGRRGFIQLTEDHTLVSRKIRDGEISADESTNHPQSGVLTQCLGVKGEIQPFVTFGTIRDEDMILLCTDGVYKSLTDEKLNKIIEDSFQKDAQDIVDIIYDEIKRSDFNDDICILLIK
ncbi:PP2C family protein-serine/threonine phosphatase [Salinicoccus halodurans]|uniref:Protein phosphatase n=1 Tax=Salinicoccus halodurans TaxID=407035 RepID=A0A0F7HJM1_9STAP|nr:PP2C family serine/threonine-protein phosphatase [Salinicoccus halodurans]AKG73262.1 hypothetical protein AAT16_02940 [Salinicoccus halodurans]SFK83165.1 protein phosphatase [Salinicoccus halodurans]